MKQTKFNLDKGRWGGRRKGSGRKRINSSGVAHKQREKITVHKPSHINIKYKLHIKNKEFLSILKRAILNSRIKGLRIIHYSVQSNHLHFIVEADNNKKLTSGMRSLTVTLARGINKGKVQLQRYHLHVLKTLQEVKNAAKYVVFNEHKHTGRRVVDPYSSVCRFLGLQFEYCVVNMDNPRAWLTLQASSARD